MAIGGMTSEAGDNLECLTGLIQIYNLTSGQWMDGYDPESFCLECDIASQYNTSSAEAADAHVEFMNPFSPRVRIGSQAVSNSDVAGEGLGLRAWVDACRDKGCAYDFAPSTGTPRARTRPVCSSMSGRLPPSAAVGPSG
ncbi:hypothetical protein ACHAQH_009696 [Verticillium albo-atrum]